jgi:hypothetical protein
MSRAPTNLPVLEEILRFNNGPDQDRWPELAMWSVGAAIDAVLAAAARYAERTNREHDDFRQTIPDHGGLALCLESIDD